MPWIAFAVMSATMFSQARVSSPRYRLIDVLVWGTFLPVDSNVYPTPLKREIDGHLRRSNAYRSKGRHAVNSPEANMLHDAQIRYERLLVAVSDDPAAPALAAEYVSTLRPCYEWEGYADCPEREARFAQAYQADHPDGPFSAFLPLLAAHRWLCAAEAYEFAKKPGEAARSRQEYEQAISAALRSPKLLIRSAARELSSNPRCIGRR